MHRHCGYELQYRAWCLQTLLEKHKEAVKAVAERLLAVETISQHDIQELVGPRPFTTDVRGAEEGGKAATLPLQHRQLYKCCSALQCGRETRLTITQAYASCVLNALCDFYCFTAHGKSA